MHRSILIGSISLSLCGCAGFGGFAASPNDLRGDSYTKSEAYCYDEQIDAVEKKVKGFLEACYRSTTASLVPVGRTVVFSSYTVNYFIEEGNISNGRQYSLKTDYGYTFGADVTSGDEARCKTKLSMHAMNAMWARPFDEIDSHVKGKEINCPL